MGDRKLKEFLSAIQTPTTKEIPYNPDDSWGYGTAPGQGTEDGTGSSDTGSLFLMGLVSYNGKEVYYIDGIPTIIENLKNPYAKCYIINHDLTLNPCWVAKYGNSYAHETDLHAAVKSAMDKEYKKVPVSERIKEFKSEYPTLSTPIKGDDFYNWHNLITGSCKLGRDEFVSINGLDHEKYYEVGYLIGITLNEYNNPQMRRLRDAYED